MSWTNSAAAICMAVVDEDDWTTEPLRLGDPGVIETSYLPLARELLNSTSYFQSTYGWVEIK
jgi:hypothetical protein